MVPARARGQVFAEGRPNPPTLRDVADPKSLDRAFKALANETRRGILAALHDRGGALSSHDIARRFDIPWQGVSRHLRLLTEAGLLTCDVHNNERAYALDHEQLRRVAGRWIMRVATPGTRDRDGLLVFDFAE
ncbi:MAG TPA: metalloregulator ArsR/SmtB family transcription factor [Acidimicrobiales bacterium]|jgi:DNA-binding transcriptional ArsR family regulator